MPSAFSITVPTNSIRLDQQRHGEAAFTVYNASGRALRARAQLAAQPPEARDWLTLNGQPERAFPIAGTIQYTVSIAIPPTAPPGSYTFHLDVVGEENPNEDFTEGPTVTFEVPEPVINGGEHFPWWIVAVIVGILAVAAVAYFLFFPGGGAPVPDVAGRTLEGAADALQEAGFIVGDETLAEPSEEVAVGSVIRTEPAAGSEVEKGAAITLVLSTGPRPVNVPDVAGQSSDDAIGALEEAGLVVEEIQEERSEEVDEGDVIRTDPAAGVEVERGVTVIVFVSLGPPPTGSISIVSVSPPATTTLTQGSSVTVDLNYSLAGESGEIRISLLLFNGSDDCAAPDRDPSSPRGPFPPQIPVPSSNIILLTSETLPANIASNSSFQESLSIPRDQPPIPGVNSVSVSVSLMVGDLTVADDTDYSDRCYPFANRFIG